MAFEVETAVSDLEDYEREVSTPEAPPSDPTEGGGPFDRHNRLVDAIALSTAALTVLGLALALLGNPSNGVPLILIGGVVLVVSIRMGIALRGAPYRLQVFTRDPPPREPPP